MKTNIWKIYSQYLTTLTAHFPRQTRRRDSISATLLDEQELAAFDLSMKQRCKQDLYTFYSSRKVPFFWADRMLVNRSRIRRHNHFFCSFVLLLNVVLK